MKIPRARRFPYRPIRRGFYVGGPVPRGELVTFTFPEAIRRYERGNGRAS